MGPFLTTGTARLEFVLNAKENYTHILIGAIFDSSVASNLGNEFNAANVLDTYDAIS